MKNILLALLIACTGAVATAGMPVHKYQIGKVAFAETTRGINMSLPAGRSVAVTTVLGGLVWPPVQLDENGQISAGNLLLDSATGNVLARHPKGPIALANGLSVSAGTKSFTLMRGTTRCQLSRADLGLAADLSPLALLRSRYLHLATSDQEVLALTHRQFDEPAGNRNAFAVRKIDLAACKVVASADLGDPDYLIELAWSKKGGWWITGAKEGVLLRSNDGIAWRQTPVDPSISSIMSAYLVDPDTIWLAAIMPAQGDADAYELLYSRDAGATWNGARPGDAVLRTMPPYWLEGARRAVAGQ
jgi:hypothetical protein